MKNSGEIFRFAVVGFSNFVIIMLTAWLLCDILAMNYLLANCCAYILALANNFYWNRVWVFRSDDRHIRRQIFLFLTAYGCAYVVQLAIVFLLVEGIGVEESLANFIGLFPFGAVNFIFNKFLTFRKH